MIATTGPDGLPHAVPVEVVVHAGRVYCWAHDSSAKVRNAARERRAALVAYKGNDFVLVRGAARVLHAGDEGYAAITAMFLEKYRRDETYGNDALIEISADHVASRIA